MGKKNRPSPEYKHTSTCGHYRQQNNDQRVRNTNLIKTGAKLMLKNWTFTRITIVLLVSPFSSV